MQPSTKIAQKKARLQEMKQKKMPWLQHWQLLGEYIHGRKQDFTSQKQDGDFLNSELYDNTAMKSNDTMGSTLLGLLWPNGARSIRISVPDGLRETREHKDYFDFVTKTMTDVMDEPKAGLQTALDEYMKDQGAFGTSAVSVFENGDDELVPLVFKSWSVKELYIDEGRDRKVDTVYVEQEFSVRQLVAEYGLSNVSQKARDLFNGGKGQDKVTVLIAIERRLDIPEEGKDGNLGKPWESCHIELGADHLLKESGFDELPIKVARFWKLIKEVYGRCPGMAALPATLELNALWEAVTIAAEKALDPPIGILDDGRLGGGVIDTSAGAINVFNITGRAGERQPVFPLYTVGEFQHVGELIERLTEEVANHFYIDRLLDLNNEKEMTAYETSVRNKLRGNTLGSLFARQIAELFNPMVERTFNILFRQGRLGVIKGSQQEKMMIMLGEQPRYIPDAIAQLMLAGKNSYRIKYITPASRIMEAEEAQGILDTFGLVVNNANIAPEMADNFDLDFGARRYSELSGAPPQMKRDEDTIKKIREARQAASEAAAKRMAAVQEADAAKKGAGAVKDLATAQQAA